MIGSPYVLQLATHLLPAPLNAPQQSVAVENAALREGSQAGQRIVQTVPSLIAPQAESAAPHQHDMMTPAPRAPPAIIDPPAPAPDAAPAAPPALNNPAAPPPPPPPQNNAAAGGMVAAAGPGAGAFGMLAAPADDEFGPPANANAAANPQNQLWLLAKLAFAVTLFSQNASTTRTVILHVAAILIFLFQTGMVRVQWVRGVLPPPPGPLVGPAVAQAPQEGVGAEGGGEAQALLEEQQQQQPLVAGLGRPTISSLQQSQDLHQAYQLSTELVSHLTHPSSTSRTLQTLGSTLSLALSAALRTAGQRNTALTFLDTLHTLLKTFRASSDAEKEEGLFSGVFNKGGRWMGESMGRLVKEGGGEVLVLRALVVLWLDVFKARKGGRWVERLEGFWVRGNGEVVQRLLGVGYLPLSRKVVEVLGWVGGCDCRVLASLRPFCVELLERTEEVRALVMLEDEEEACEFWVDPLHSGKVFDRQILRDLAGLFLGCVEYGLESMDKSMLEELKGFDVLFKGLLREPRLCVCVFKLLSDNDAALIQFMIKLIRTSNLLKERMSSSNKATRMIISNTFKYSLNVNTKLFQEEDDDEEGEEEGGEKEEKSTSLKSYLNPHAMFYLFLHHSYFDPSLLLDLLISSETQVLEFLVEYIKYATATSRELVESIQFISEKTEEQKQEHEEEEAVGGCEEAVRGSLERMKECFSGLWAKVVGLEDGGVFPYKAGVLVELLEGMVQVLNGILMGMGGEVEWE
ncbi:hypothetical protein HDV05_000544 [Chytridiales sp. JEL 0842]|nr:hypothetical protein HDV05_000544 [Chytridiales sp. JEL 0842]